MRWFLGFGVALLVLANCTWWSSRIPFDDGPDEADHYRLLEFVARQGRLPRYGEERFVMSLMDSQSRERFLGPDRYRQLVADHRGCEQRKPYLFTPQLPYLLGGTIMRHLVGPSVVGARLVSALWLTLAALCTFWAGLLLWPHRPSLAAAAALSFALWPQTTFLGAYINDDVFAVLAVAALVLGVVAVERRGARWGPAALLAVGAALVASSKYYNFALFPLLLVWAIVHARRKGARFFAVVAAAVLVGVAASVPLFVRNTLLYGDPLGLAFLTRELDVAARALPADLRAQTNLLHNSPADRHITWAALHEREWLRSSLRSMWGVFGWMSRRIYPSLYTAAAVVVPSALVLPWLYRLVRRKRTPPVVGPQLAPSLFGVPFFFLLIAFSLANTFSQDFQAQGRYLLPATPPLLLQLFGGVDRVEGIVARYGVWLLFAFFAVQNVVAGLFYIQ